MNETSNGEKFRVGFALEPQEHLLERAQAKINSKGVDAIVANPLDTMESSTVTATVLFDGGMTLEAPKNLDKATFATWLLEQITPHLPTSA